MNHVDPTRSSRDWEDPSKADAARRRPPQEGDSYRKVERDKQKPPTKDEQEEGASVTEKKEKSIFDLSRKAPKKGISQSQSGIQKAPPKEEPEEPQYEEVGEGEGEKEEFAGGEMKKELTASNMKKEIAAEESVKTALPVSKEGGKTEGAPSKKDKVKGEDQKSSSESSLEKVSGGAAQASMQAVHFGIEKGQEAQEAAKSTTIKEIVAQIVERVQIMKRDDLTSTIITLKSPPELAGSTITLTATEHAKREFNITFANLSPDGKMLLDRKLKEDSLTETLDRKGIIVHHIITTTQPERVLSAEQGQGAQEQRDREGQQQGRQGREQEEEEA